MKTKHKYTIAAICLGLSLSASGCKSKLEAPKAAPAASSDAVRISYCDRPYEFIAKKLSSLSGSPLSQSDIDELSTHLIIHSPIDVYPIKPLDDVFSYICIIEPRIDDIKSPVYSNIPICGATGNRDYYIVAITGENSKGSTIKIKLLGDFFASSYEAKPMKNHISIKAKAHISSRKHSVNAYRVDSLRMSKNDSWVEEYDEDGNDGTRITKLK